MIRYLLHIFCTTISLSIIGQNLQYEIVRGDSKIGYLEIIHKRGEDHETFSIKNVVELKMLFTFSVEYVLSENFVNGTLRSGKGYNSMNGHVDKETSLETTTEGYSLIMDGISATAEKYPIRASVSQIYHQEPYDEKPIYSQYFGRYLYAKKIADHQYSVVSPDGENIYTYENGYCKEVKVTRDFATFYIRISPESLTMIKKGR